MASRHLLRRTFLLSGARFSPPAGGVPGRILPPAGRSGSSSLLARFGQVGHLSTWNGYYRHQGAGYADRLRGWWRDIGERLTFLSLYVFYMGSLAHIYHKEKKWVYKKWELTRVMSDDMCTIILLEHRLQLHRSFHGH